MNISCRICQRSTYRAFLRLSFLGASGRIIGIFMSTKRKIREIFAQLFYEIENSKSSKEVGIHEISHSSDWDFSKT